MFEDISKFFKSLFSAKSGKKGKFPVFIAVVCILILIPTVFAIFYAYFYDESSFLSVNEIQVELYDASGGLVASENVLEANADDSPLVSVFKKINATKVITEKPSDFNKSPTFRVIIKNRNQTEEYFCYFSDLDENNFLEAKNGAFFTVEPTAFTSFLNSSFSEAAYSEASPPALITGNGETVTPASVQWHYKKKNGRVASSALCATTAEKITYKIGGAINLNFQKAPDVCSTAITDADGNELFSGSLDELPFLTIESGTLLNAKISASWKNGEHLLAFGEVIYEFKISVGDRAQFSLSEDELSAAQFAMLSAKNVDDISKLIFSLTSQHKESDFDENSPEVSALRFINSYSPTFLPIEDELKAAIVFPAGTPSGDYELSIAFGAEKQLFTIKIKESAATEKTTLNKPFSELSAAVSDSAKIAFQSIIGNVPPITPTLILFKSPFLSPLESGFTEGYKYGDTISAADKDDITDAIGNEYLSSAVGGSPVPVLNTGIVVAAGYSTHLGNYVAVEHGLGIRTWYCCLSSIDVEVGDALAKGESVGKCGTNGLLSASGTVILCSIYDCLIDPDFIIGKEIKY